MGDVNIRLPPSSIKQLAGLLQLPSKCITLCTAFFHWHLLAPQSGAHTRGAFRAGTNGYPIPDSNPKYFSIPEPYPINFQNHRVFRVSGIRENQVFFTWITCACLNCSKFTDHVVTKLSALLFRWISMIYDAIFLARGWMAYPTHTFSDMCSARLQRGQ